MKSSSFKRIVDQYPDGFKWVPLVLYSYGVLPDGWSARPETLDYENAIILVITDTEGRTYPVVLKAEYLPAIPSYYLPGGYNLNRLGKERATQLRKMIAYFVEEVATGKQAN